MRDARVPIVRVSVEDPVVNEPKKDLSQRSSFSEWWRSRGAAGEGARGPSIEVARRILNCPQPSFNQRLTA